MKIINLILVILLLACWQNGRAVGTDPNQIVFSVTFHHDYNLTNPIEAFQVYSGSPRYESVLVVPLASGRDYAFVSDAEFKKAVWTPYDGIVRMPLGPTDGTYQVWFGLKGADTSAAPAWFGTDATLTRSKPQIFITNPMTNVVATPYIQLQGYSALPLDHVRFDYSNAVSFATNQQGHIIEHTLDISTSSYTTDYFQCYDIPLNNGVNAITLRCTDPAGNLTTTNLKFTLDYSIATNPTIQLTWPQDRMDICGDTFTLRGHTEDASSTITASITDTNGNIKMFNGIVERTGVLWVNNLPLHDGTNKLTLTVKNSAGFSSMTNINVTHSPFVLKMDPVKDDLWLPKVTVTGFESDGTYPVWVNGVRGTVHLNADGTGKWIVHDVPTTPGGVASFHMHAYAPDEIQPDGFYGDGRVVTADKASVGSTTNPNTAAAKTNTTNQGTALVATPEQPVFLKISQSNGTLYFTWSTVPNSTYQLQYVTELTSTNWLNLGNPITATSNSVSATDTLGKDMQRLYHVKLVK